MKEYKPLRLGIFFTKVKMIIRSHSEKENDDNPKKEVVYYRKTTRDMLLDSLIVGLVVFVASLPITSLPTLCSIYDALRGFFYYFLIQLAIDRATTTITKRQNNNNNNNKR